MSRTTVLCRWSGCAVAVALLGAAFVGSPLVGQAEEPASEEAAAPEEAYGQIEEILEGEEEILAGGGYNYDPGDRRDPFVSLLRRTLRTDLPSQRPEGKAGLLIDEVDIKGIFALEGRLFAQVQTADKEKSYIIEEGDALFDGEVVSINRNEVVFKQEVNDPSIIKPFREVVKKLNPEP